METTTQEIIVLVTAGSADQADEIGTALVEERLAACVNVVGPIRSIYRWQGKIERDDELLLVIKSAAHIFSRLEARVRELHSYDTPEVIALPIAAGSEPYLRWLRESLEN